MSETGDKLIAARFQTTLGDFELDVDMQLPIGISVFYGHSGCGKTTLLRCIAGLELADNGLLRVGEHIWQDSRKQLFLPVHKRALGYVFQEACLFPHLNVRKNLQYGRKRAAFLKNPAGLDQAIELLGIGHLLERMPERLSGGERQRVAIARALAACPQILLMDEPLAALDAERKLEILPFLGRLQSELDIPVLYVTHSPQELTRLADHLVVLKEGRVLVSGSLEETLTRLNSPLSQGKRAATVQSYDDEFQLLQVGFQGGSLYLSSANPVKAGTSLRVRIYASDVSLAPEAGTVSSILNILPAQVTGIVHDAGGKAMVRLLIGEAALLSQITRKSAAVLGLKAGMRVFAQIKATAIL